MVPQLTLNEAASEMYPEWQRVAFKAPPYKHQFRGHFDPNFSYNLDWGTKITLENFFKIWFIARKIPFLHTFSLTSRNSCFTSEI